MDEDIAAADAPEEDALAGVVEEEHEATREGAVADEQEAEDVVLDVGKTSDGP